MDTIALLFASGRMFFVGLILATACCLVRLAAVRPFARRLLGIFSLVGGGLALLSASPVPLVLQMLWLIVLVAALVVPHRSSRRLRRLSMLVAGAAVAGSFLLLAMELPYYVAPRIPLKQGQVIYVIGDSISAGWHANTMQY